MRKAILILTLGLFAISGCQEDSLTPSAQDEPTSDLLSKRPRAQQDDDLLAKLHEINAALAERGLNIRVNEVHFFTIGKKRPSARILQQQFNWVASDVRRVADGDNLTYIVDQSEGATASGLTNAQTEAAVDAALTTWDNVKPMRKVDVVKRGDPGTDITIFDALVGFGGFGNPFAADIVNAGWWPKAFFDAVGGPGGGDGILAFSVSFIFTSGDGTPTDINNDQYLDTALNEVYYNDNFGDPGGTRAGFPWGIAVDLPGIDVETVAFHENGHSFGLGHFGPPPTAVMNPVYAGQNTSPYPIDLAGLATVYNNWPN